MQNTTASYSLPSPQSNANFSLSIIGLSNKIDVVSNQATMYVLTQGSISPPPYTQKFRWIPVSTSWNDETSTELVNFLQFCTFNFGAYALCTVQTVEGV